MPKKAHTEEQIVAVLQQGQAGETTIAGMEIPNELRGTLHVTVIGHSYRVEFAPPTDQDDVLCLAPREVESAPKMAKYLEGMGETAGDARARIKQLQEERTISIPVTITVALRVDKS